MQQRTLIEDPRRQFRSWCLSLARGMQRALTCSVPLLVSSLTFAGAPTPTPVAAPPPGQRLAAQGARDGKVPAWTITAVAPPGWTADCCTYAKAIGVNFVLYQGEWTGEPDRVMVLNVWPRKLPTFTAEWQTDRTHYLKRDPLAKVVAFPLVHPALPCHGLLYQGTDHIDDIVVFCDAGKTGGVRFSWSMTVAADDPLRAQVTTAFQQVVTGSRYVPARRTDATSVAPHVVQPAVHKAGG